MFRSVFSGVVIDSIEPTPDKKGIETMRQIYSLDSLDSGMTVEIIMAARPSIGRSYVPGDQNGKNLLESVGGTCHLPILMHLLWEVSHGKNDGTDGQRTAAFLNPMIHTYTSTVKLYDTEAHIQKDWVDEVIDQWGM